MTMDLKQYRMMDLGLLTLLAIASEVLGDFLHKALPSAGFYLSFSVLITLIAIIRWGKIGSIVLILAGIPMVLLGPNSIGVNLLLYPIANGGVILAAIVIERIGKERLVADLLKMLLMIIGTHLAIALSKGLAVMVLGEPLLNGVILYLLANIFNIVMTYVVMVLIRKRQGLLIDMKNYFEREQNDHEYSS